MSWTPKAVALCLCVAAAATTNNPAGATDDRMQASIVWSFDHQGMARFCYGKDPEIIYFRYDVASRTTSIESKSLNGQERTIARFSGPPDQRSLSCSEDGTTIAALDGDKKNLYIVRGNEISRYNFDPRLLYSVHGRYSLLGPDGKMISVPGLPRHVSGPDVLKDMALLVSDSTENTFFEIGGVYVEKPEQIVRYKYVQNNWKQQDSYNKSPNFGVKEIARCGRHDVASMSDDETAQFHVLDERLPAERDWLSRVGVRKLFGTYHDLIEVTGGYGRCAFPLYRRDKRPWEILDGLAVFDDRTIEIFSIGGPQIVLSNREVPLSKDGCYAVLRAFKQVPDVPQFTLPQQVALVNLVKQDCKPVPLRR